jgi:hypothetical protein
MTTPTPVELAWPDPVRPAAPYDPRFSVVSDYDVHALSRALVAQDWQRAYNLCHYHPQAVAAIEAAKAQRLAALTAEWRANRAHQV